VSADKTLKKAQVQGTPAYRSAIRQIEIQHRRTGLQESSIAIEIQDENDFPNHRVAVKTGICWSQNYG